MSDGSRFKHLRNARAKVYCGECKHYVDMHSCADYFPSIGRDYDQCMANKIELDSYDQKIYTYGRCIEINEDNDCADYEPKMSKRIATLFRKMWEGIFG